MEEMANSLKSSWSNWVNKIKSQESEIQDEIKQHKSVIEIICRIFWFSHIIIPLQKSSIESQRNRLNKIQTPVLKDVALNILQDSELAHEETEEYLQALKSRLAELQNQQTTDNVPTLDTNQNLEQEM